MESLISKYDHTTGLNTYDTLSSLICKCIKELKVSLSAGINNLVPDTLMNSIFTTDLNKDQGTTGNISVETPWILKTSLWPREVQDAFSWISSGHDLGILNTYLKFEGSNNRSRNKLNSRRVNSKTKITSNTKKNNRRRNQERSITRQNQGKRKPLRIGVERQDWFNTDNEIPIFDLKTKQIRFTKIIRAHVSQKVYFFAIATDLNSDLSVFNQLNASQIFPDIGLHWNTLKEGKVDFAYNQLDGLIGQLLLPVIKGLELGNNRIACKEVDMLLKTIIKEDITLDKLATNIIATIQAALCKFNKVELELKYYKSDKTTLNTLSDKVAKSVNHSTGLISPLLQIIYMIKQRNKYIPNNENAYGDAFLNAVNKAINVCTNTTTQEKLRGLLDDGALKESYADEQLQICITAIKLSVHSQLTSFLHN